MKQLDINMLVGVMSTNISKLIQDTLDQLQADFASDSSNNEQVALEADLYATMNQYIVYTLLNSQYKKAFDRTKKNLDRFAEDLGADIEGKAGVTQEIASVNGLVFSKERNKDGTTTLVTDLVNQLNRLGVDKDIIDTACKNAEKPKKGNTYYQVEGE